MSTPSWLRRGGVELAVSVGVAAAAVVVALLLIASAGGDPYEAATAFVDGAFGGKTAITGTLSKMVPLVLVALGWIVIYRAGRFHVGFPGQILIGGMAATIVGLAFDGLPRVVHLPLAIGAAIVAGGGYAWLVAWLWARRNVNELLSTLLLNLVAIQVVSYLVRGPFQESGGDLAQTDPLPESALWPSLVPNTVLHWDVVLIPLGVVAIWWLLSRTLFGFQVRFVGTNEDAARQAGISIERVGSRAIILSGVLAGLAGASLVLAGEAPGTADDFGSDYGFQGIAVALLAYNSPIGVIPAALMFAALRQGGGVMEATVGVSSALIGVTQGIVIIFVLVGVGLLIRRRRRTGGIGAYPVAPAAPGGAGGGAA